LRVRLKPARFSACGPREQFMQGPHNTPIDNKNEEKKDKMNASDDSAKKVEVRAPMSGVFYTTPSPDQPPYVAVGDTVKKKQVLALLETMKVFQKVKSPANGKNRRDHCRA